MLVARDALGFAAISGYDHEVLAAAKRRAPELVLAPERVPDDVPVVPAAAPSPRPPDSEAPILQNHYSLLTDELVETLHAAGVALWSWTINEEAHIVDSIAIGADGLMGDDVRLLVEVADRPGARACLSDETRPPATRRTVRPPPSSAGGAMHSRCRPTPYEPCHSTGPRPRRRPPHERLSRSRPAANRPLRT